MRKLNRFSTEKGEIIATTLHSRGLAPHSMFGILHPCLTGSYWGVTGSGVHLILSPQVYPGLDLFEHRDGEREGVDNVQAIRVSTYLTKLLTNEQMNEEWKLTFAYIPLSYTMVSILDCFSLIVSWNEICPKYLFFQTGCVPIYYLIKKHSPL